MTAPFGTTPYGLGAYGSGTYPITLLSAYATSTNEVLVTASGNMIQRSPALSGDATNPSTWRIIRTDMNAIVPVVAVTAISATQVSLRTLIALPPASVKLQLSVPVLLYDANGGFVSVPTPLSFAGMTELARATQAAIAQGMVNAPIDLMNRQFPSGVTGSLSGSIVVQSGDYALQTGTELLKKLILRRLVAAPGDFYHLPNYGVGLRAKQPLPVGSLKTLKGNIERQLLQEPEIASATATLTQSANQLNVVVKVKVKATGEEVSVGVPFSFGANA